MTENNLVIVGGRAHYPMKLSKVQENYQNQYFIDVSFEIRL